MPTVFKYVKALAPVNLLNGALWLEEEDISKIPEAVFNLPEIQEAIANDELVEVNPNDLPQDVVSPTMKLRGEWDPTNRQLPMFRRVGDTYKISADAEVNGIQLTAGTRVLFTALDTFEVVGAGGNSVSIEDWILVSSSQTLGVSGHYYWDLRTSYDITLPATPLVGDFVEVYHILGTVGAYDPKPRILRNGELIQGIAEDLNWNLDLYRVTFTFVGGTLGWIIYSASIQLGGSDPVVAPRSGSVWLKAVTKQVGEPSNTKVLTKTSGIKTDILELSGDSALIKVTAAVIPGADSGNPVVYAYAVPGEFSPTPDVPLPIPLTPKVTATFTQIRSNLEDELDHLEFEANIPVIFSGNKAQVVLELASGGFVVVPYYFELVPQLISCDITSSYAVGRTGFSAGSVVTLSFTATQNVDYITVWPHDAISTSLPEPFVPSTYAVTPAASSGTISITIGAMNLVSSNTDTGKLFVSATQYGQHTKVIQTTTNKVFDERTPLNTATVVIDYPGAQTAIKGTEDATITVSSLGIADKLTPVYAPNNYLQASPSNPPTPYSVVLGEVTFSVRRNATFNGRVDLPLTATNTRSGKSSTITATLTRVSVEGATFPDPEIVVNDGLTVVTEPLGKVVEVRLNSSVSLANPVGDVTLPGVSISSWSSLDNGHTWIASGTIFDSSPRGTQTASASGLVTGTGTAVATISGDYRVSGFTRRAIPVTTPFSNVVSLGAIVVDGTLEVLDLGLQPTPFSYAPNSITLLDAELYEANATGAMPIYVSQGPAV